MHYYARTAGGGFKSNDECRLKKTSHAKAQRREEKLGCFLRAFAPLREISYWLHSIASGYNSYSALLINPPSAVSA